MLAVTGQLRQNRDITMSKTNNTFKNNEQMNRCTDKSSIPGDAAHLMRADTLRIAGVVKESIVDGPGIRFTVFCQGCPHACPGCHNTQTHDFDGGFECKIDKIVAAIDDNPLLSGVTFSGGEPACQPTGFYELALKVKERGLSLWMYSGYTLEELSALAGMNPQWASPTDVKSAHSSDLQNRLALRGLLETIDVLIDGRYIDELRDLTLPFRGSKNQRLIDMAETRRTNRLTLYDPV